MMRTAMYAPAKEPKIGMMRMMRATNSRMKRKERGVEKTRFIVFASSSVEREMVRLGLLRLRREGFVVLAGVMVSGSPGVTSEFCTAILAA